MRLIYVFILVIFITSCNNSSSQKRSFRMGLMYWNDENYSDVEIKKAIGITIENSDVLTAQISWSPEDSVYLDKFKWIANLARIHNRELIFNIDWLSFDRSGVYGEEEWNFKDTISRRKYIQSVYAICKKYNPNIINLGVEVNYYALTSPDDFKNFVDVYNFTRELIKSNFPNIKVGLTFQLELLRGTHERWIGNDSFSILKAFGDNYDYIGISTYPNLLRSNKFNRIGFQKLISYSDKDILIFETSLPTYNSIDNKNQLNYIIDLFQSTNNSRVKLIIWTSTLDIKTNPDIWHNHLGLSRYNFDKKPSYDVWRRWYLKPIVYSHKGTAIMDHSN